MVPRGWLEQPLTAPKAVVLPLHNLGIIILVAGVELESTTFGV